MVSALEVTGCVTEISFALAVLDVHGNKVRPCSQVSNVVKSPPAFLVQEVGDSISYWETLA